MAAGAAHNQGCLMSSTRFNSVAVPAFVLEPAAQALADALAAAGSPPLHPLPAAARAVPPVRSSQSACQRGRGTCLASPR